METGRAWSDGTLKLAARASIPFARRERFPLGLRLSCLLIYKEARLGLKAA
jgi:hypothetical protein